MEEEFKTSVGFATIGSLCIVIATFLKNHNFNGIEIVSGGFLLTGCLMVFSSALLLCGGMANINWDEEKVAKFIVRISIVIFFFSSLALLILYIISLFV